ncbi:competence protein CoiA family protein [Cryobacterium sp. AP23]
MIHDASTLRLFQAQGESRLVFARASDSSVVFMPDGQAEEFRERTRSGELTCIVPDCQNRRLVAFNRGARRHGFAHRANAGGHAGMGLHHLQSQLLVADWLRQRYPECRVELEETTEDSQRRADVMLTSPRGRKAAFEIQYAAITPRAWQERHDSYAALGIVDVWLWGHTAPHLRRSRESESDLELNPTLVATAAAGLPLLWINPELSRIGTATNTRRLETGHLEYEVMATHGRGRFVADPLTAYRLDGTLGFTSDRVESLRRNQTEYERLVQEVRLRTDRETAASEAAAIRKATHTASWRERVRQKAVDHRERWLESPERSLIFNIFDSKWPRFLSIAPTGGYDHRGEAIYLPFPDEQWQTMLYLRFMHGKIDRSSVTITECAAHLETLDQDVRLAKEAVTSWFHAMAKLGVVERVESTRRDGSRSIRYVTRDVRVVAGERAAVTLAEAERRQHTKRVAEQKARDRHRREAIAAVPLRSVPELRAAGYTVQDLPLALQDGRHCHHCYGAVETLESYLGYHRGCASALHGCIGASTPNG